MKQIAMLLYPGFTPLDAIGPYHALSQFPGYEFSYVALEAGPISDGTATTLIAHKSISEISSVEILIVPGGLPAITMARAGDPLIDWIAKIHPKTEWTISVCTGALMLGAAGILKDVPATTHWYSHSELKDYGAIPTDERVVEYGKIITAAGVSAGIDMSLTLAMRLFGQEFAETMQLDMEYDPKPPFNAGHPRTAPAKVHAKLRELFDSVLLK
ncbi:MAG: DJ-1/PfpI family protein [Candidatus Nanopelagicaceae bacterium]